MVLDDSVPNSANNLSQIIKGYAQKINDSMPSESLDDKFANMGELSHYIAQSFYVFWVGQDLNTMLGPDTWTNEPYLRRQLAIGYRLEAIRLLGQLVEDIEKQNLSKLSVESSICLY